MGGLATSSQQQEVAVSLDAGYVVAIQLHQGSLSAVCGMLCLAGLQQSASRTSPAYHLNIPQVRWAGELQCNAFPPEAVDAVLLWADLWLSARTFGGGLCALICFRQVAVGESFLLLSANHFGQRLLLQVPGRHCSSAPVSGRQPLCAHRQVSIFAIGSGGNT